MVGSKKSSARWERADWMRIGFVAQSGEGQAHHRIGVGEFGDEDEIFRSRFREDVQKSGCSSGSYRPSTGIQTGAVSRKRCSSPHAAGSAR